MVRKQTLTLGLLASLWALPAIYAEANSEGSATTHTSSGAQKTDGVKEADGVTHKDGDQKDSGNTHEASGNKDVANPSETQKDGGNVHEASHKEGTGTAGGATATTDQSDTTKHFSEDQIKAIKEVINVTLKENPKIIVEALQNFTDGQQQEQMKKLNDGLVKNKDRIIDPASAIVYGNQDADKKLVVFLDPICPHCRRFEQALDKLKTSDPKVAIVLRYWPILGADSEKVVSGLLAVKSMNKAKYEEIAKTIATTEGAFTYDMFLKLVASHKLDKAKFDEAVNSAETKSITSKTDSLARELGLQGTPTSLLVTKDNIRLVMPTDEKSLEAILKGEAKEEPKTS